MNKFYASRLAFINEALDETRPHEPRSILDVGFVGDIHEKRFHYFLVDALKKDDRLLGIDIDEAGVNEFLASEETQARRKEKDLKYQVMSISDNTFNDNEFDLVWMFETFEHLISPYAVLHEVHRILKPGGALIMTYPSPLDLKRLVRYMFRKDLLDERYLEDFKGNPDHKVFPHPVCMSLYLQRVGFEVKRIGFLKFNFRYALLNALLSRITPMQRLASNIGIHAVKTG
ncbi:MAG: methyltransferase domain-containing protein [Planctomycetota bacterium]